MDQNNTGFLYFKIKFLRISDAKIKEGVTAGPQIRQFIQDVKFEDQLSEAERAEWKSFKNITANFGGNHKVDIYCVIVADLVQYYRAKGCNKSLEGHFLDFYLDFFPENLRTVSGEHAERFNKDINTMEMRYQGKMSSSMLADY